MGSVLAAFISRSSCEAAAGFWARSLMRLTPGTLAAICLRFAVPDSPLNSAMNAPIGRSSPSAARLAASFANAASSYHHALVGSAGTGLRQPSPAVAL